MNQEPIVVPLLRAPQTTKLQNCHPDAEGLGQSYISSQPVCLESVNSHMLLSAVSASFTITILSLPFSYSLSTLFSTGLPEIGQVLGCGTLNLLPSGTE